MKKYNGFYISDNIIYHWSPKKCHFLKMTNFTPNEDRRYLPCYFDNKEVKHLNTQVALRQINQYWKGISPTWEYNGEIFKTDNIDSFKQLLDHKFDHTYVSSNGKVNHYTYNYNIVWHQGKIWWLVSSHYYPQVELLPFKSIDVEPEWYNCKWTKFSNCKKIINSKGEVI